MTEKSILSSSVRELIAIGASIGGNCLPCLRYHFAEALANGCSLDEISEAIELSKTVKERPMKDIYRLADELLLRERQTTPIPTPKKEDTNANL
jgi:AhpD family alkylhydroperoxidase